MKNTIIFGGLCSVLLCSCAVTKATDNSETSVNMGQQAASTEIPTSLTGYKLTLSTRNATKYATGSAGMEKALKKKLKDYKSYDWSPYENTTGIIQFGKLTFTEKTWKSGNNSGSYELEKAGKGQLFLTIIVKEEEYEDYISILLDFQSSDAGVAIWAQEHSFTGNIQFTLKK